MIFVFSKVYIMYTKTQMFNLNALPVYFFFKITGEF